MTAAWCVSVAVSFHGYDVLFDCVGEIAFVQPNLSIVCSQGNEVSGALNRGPMMAKRSVTGKFVHELRTHMRDETSMTPLT